MVEAALQAVVRLRAAVLLAVLAVSAGAVISAGGVGFDSDVSIWFLDDDPELVTYEAFLSTFRTDEMLVVGLFADDVFTPEVLDATHDLTAALETLPNVHRVRSVTNATRFESDADTLRVVPLVPNIPVSAAQARTARAQALGDPLIAGPLVAPDGRASAVVVELASSARRFEDKVALVQAIRAAAQARLPEGIVARVAGTPAINEAVFRYSRRDFGLLGSIALGLVLVLTFAMFRHTWATILPLCVVGVSVLWLFGLMGALGLNINLVSQSLTVVVFAVGVADSIHVLSEYQRALVNTEDRHEALVEALRTVFWPCVFTTVTTAAGMLSLGTSSLAPIREFGGLAAAGVGFALVLSFTFLPAALSLLAPPPHARLAKQEEGPLSRVLHWTATVARIRRRRVLAAFGLAVAGGLYLVPQLEVGANPAAYFKTNDPVRQEMRAVDEALGGSTSIELFVTTEPDGLQDPERLARLAALQDWLQTLPSVARVGSILDGLEALNLALTGTAALPRTEAAVAQAYLLIEDEPDFAALVTDDYARGRVSARVRMSEAAALVDRIPEIEARLASEYGQDDLRVEPTGFVKLISEMEIYIVDAQIQSFALAFGLISLLMVLLLRSVRLGLFAMIPNLGPVVIGLGVMCLLDIPLDPGTAMLGSLTLGLVVDDTVHMTTRIRHHLGRGLDTESAVTSAVVEVGRALCITTAILAVGFGVLSLGSFTPNIYLGIMAATIVVLALVADLLVLPAALLSRRR